MNKFNNLKIDDDDMILFESAEGISELIISGKELFAAIDFAQDISTNVKNEENIYLDINKLIFNDCTITFTNKKGEETQISEKQFLNSFDFDFQKIYSSLVNL